MAGEGEGTRLESLITQRLRPDRRLRLVEASARTSRTLGLMSQSEIERLLRTSPLDISAPAAQILAQYPLGGTAENIARLILAGRLALLEEEYREPLFTGTIPKEAEPPEEPPGPTPTPETGWIEILLVNEDEQPIAGEDYKITLPDGTIRAGKLDAGGHLRLDAIPQGTCWVQFPMLGLHGSTTTP